jgi:hypothetical protein
MFPALAGCGASSNAPTVSSSADLAKGGTAGQTTVGGKSLLLGRAFLPSNYGGAAVANAAFSVVDLDTGQTVFTGLTDGNGQYTALVAAQNSIAVIVTGGPFRVSGLMNPAQQGGGKDFNGVTDVACQAGVTAVTAKAISGAQLTAGRIQNLELAAAQLTQSVDFFNRDSVTQAANLVRQLTNDGANPPA